MYLGMTDKLRQVLLEEDNVAICRIVKRSNEAPRFHALVPQRREAGAGAHSLRVPEGFYVVPLPFAEDISMFQCLYAYWLLICIKMLDCVSRVTYIWLVTLHQEVFLPDLRCRKLYLMLIFVILHALIFELILMRISFGSFLVLSDMNTSLITLQLPKPERFAVCHLRAFFITDRRE